MNYKLIMTEGTDELTLKAIVKEKIKQTNT